MKRAILLLGAALVLSSTADARPRVGVALSGGSARGLAHIGILQVFEEEGVPVDLLTGTSMGAIIGGLKAAGYSAAAIETVATATDWPDLFSGAVTRRDLALDRRRDENRYLATLPLTDEGLGLPRGLVSGQKISALLTRLTLPVHGVNDFERLPTPFRCVATDIVTGEAVALDEGLLAEAMRASMAIPSVFSPVELDGRLLVDGMLVRNLPAQDARAMGADVVIGVDVGSPLATRDELDSFVAILGQATAIFSAQADIEQRALCDVVIEVVMDDVEVSDFDAAAAIIELGREAATAALPRIRELIGPTIPAAAPTPTIAVPDSLRLLGIDVETAEPGDVPMILAALDLPEHGMVAPSDLERAVGRIYGTGFYERVGYRVRPQGDGVRLVIRTGESTGDVFRFGLRYDTRDELAALFDVLLRDVPGGNARLELSGIVGERNRVDVAYLRPSVIGRHLALVLQAGWADEYLDVFVDDRRSARYDVDVIFAEAMLGSFIGDRLAVGAGVRSEWSDLRTGVGSGGYEEVDEDLLALVGTAWFDDFDRADFPSAGLSFFTRHEISEDGWGSDVGFTRHYAELRTATPLGGGFVLTSHAGAGTSTGEGLPPHDVFVLGGVDTPVELLQRDLTRTSFLGLHARQLLGPHVQFVQLGVRAELRRDVFLHLRGNVGNTFGEWSLEPDLHRYEKGWGLTLATATVFGPLEYTVARGTPGDWIQHLNFGMKF